MEEITPWEIKTFFRPLSDRGAFLAFSEEGLAFDKRVKESERLAVAYLKSSSTTLSGKQD